MFLIGGCLATQNKQYWGTWSRRSDEVNAEHAAGTKLTCSDPAGAGEVTLDSNDKKLLTKDMFETFGGYHFIWMRYLGIQDIEDGAFSTMPEEYVSISINICPWQDPMQMGIKVTGTPCDTPGCRWYVNYVQQSSTTRSFTDLHFV